MATSESTSLVETIGATAGEIWRVLLAEGELTTTQLAKQVNAPRDQVMQAVGWLAREGKIRYEQRARSKVVSLC
jgi:predicted transcriptional regulator